MAGFLMFSVFALTIISNSGGLSTHVGDSLSLGASLFANQTIISKNGTFELGFFSPNGSKNWYVGIWYTSNIPEQFIVWVANRETPAKNNPGVLKLSQGGNLGLFDAEGESLWSVHISSKGSQAVLLDSGNFVMLRNDNKSEIAWQSFDYPVDTWLPGMWFGGQQKLIGWKSSMDPAPGLFSLWPDLSGPIIQAILIWNNSVHYWESGPWDGKSFSGIPEMLEGVRYTVNFTIVSSRLYVSYNLPNGMLRFFQVKNGEIQVYALLDDNKWSNVAARPRDQCAVYGFCGAYGSCNSNNIQFCTCVEGFHPPELKIATRYFRTKLGSGGFGTVFKGSLTDGTLVAVKKLEGSRQHEKQFRAEISCLGNIQHVNLIRLRGFCAQGSRRLLVYEYMPNGSLNSFLFTSNSKSKQKVLDWRSRFQIALGTARGLVYLHEECRDRIIHGDVKPENILLDSDFSPKLADFGLAKLMGRDFSKVLTTTRGTRGYLAPEWISGLPITPKVDVYSFGITLLEIMSGRRSLDFNVQDSSQYYFPAWAATQICQGKIIDIIDKAIATEPDFEEVRKMGIVGLLCIEREEEKRPSMELVVRMLEGKMEPPTLHMPTSESVDKQGSDGSSTS